ncbi:MULTISPECIES: hypothetical protein [unclassified Streptomyces]|uniref:hypothetical protein n=1 Tax=unclassified Streptomyces TaxID=2593676 RepID=UPI00081D477D|nr:hypothetical protein [Streptomyces sp. LcepLS]MYR26785.1 hypothetical protein [Streptomyces sp. SID4945]SCF11136.1 hypothetical protein GA0115257_10709 [Streptomyces sp. LcepLS]
MPRTPLRVPRAAAGFALLAVLALLATGCGSGDDWAGPRAAPTPLGALGAGFAGPSPTPTPEATVTPQPGSWKNVHPPRGYRVVLLTAGDDRPTKTLVRAVREWADAEDVALRTVRAEGEPDLLPAIGRAMDLGPDLVLAVGNTLVDPLATVTPHHLDRHFLVVGAELAEPTENVTAVDWSGASFRGEGLGMSSTYDASSFTPARSAAAVRAGVAAVLHGLTGIVVWVDKY